MNWMFPYTVSTTMGADTAGNTAPSEPDWPTSPMPSAGGDQETGSVSSPSAASFSSSSSSADHLSFITSTKRNSSASPLCFGARRLLWRSRAHVPKTKQEEEEEAPKGDVVGRYLRKISRRLRKARAVVKESAPPCRRGAAVDDTARERAEAVASAVAYCNESLRRSASTTTVRLVSSPSLDCWLRGWQEEDTASAAAHCNGEYRVSQCPPPPRQDGWLLERQPKAALRNDLPRRPSPCPDRGHDAGDNFSVEVATAKETAKSLLSPSDSLHRELSISRSFDEIEFLKLCGGEDEIVGCRFITIRIC